MHAGLQAVNTVYPGTGPWSTVYKDPANKNNITFEPQWDPLYMAALAAYFQSRGIGSFIWWAWNSDGGDTGGIPANDSFFWQQGGANNVHRVLPNNGVPWTDVRCPLVPHAMTVCCCKAASSCSRGRCRAPRDSAPGTRSGTHVDCVGLHACMHACTQRLSPV